MSLMFPANVVEFVVEQAALLNGVNEVLKRPLRTNDPNGSVGVFANLWSPEEHQIGQQSPSIETWMVTVHSFIQHMDEEDGIQEHTELAGRVRHMLYRSQDFRVGLVALRSTSLGLTEKVQRWGIRQQRFISNEVSNQYLYLTITEFWFDTESVPQ